MAFWTHFHCKLNYLYYLLDCSKRPVAVDLVSPVPRILTTALIFLQIHSFIFSFFFLFLSFFNPEQLWSVLMIWTVHFTYNSLHKSSWESPFWDAHSENRRSGWLLPLYELVEGQQLSAVTDSYETAVARVNSEAGVINAWGIHKAVHVWFSEGVSVVCLFVSSQPNPLVSVSCSTQIHLFINGICFNSQQLIQRPIMTTVTHRLN